MPLARAEPCRVAHRTNEAQRRDDRDAEAAAGPASQPVYVVTTTPPGSRPGRRHRNEHRAGRHEAGRGAREQCGQRIREVVPAALLVAEDGHPQPTGVAAARDDRHRTSGDPDRLLGPAGRTQQLARSVAAGATAGQEQIRERAQHIAENGPVPSGRAVLFAAAVDYSR